MADYPHADHDDLLGVSGFQLAVELHCFKGDLRHMVDIYTRKEGHVDKERFSLRIYSLKLKISQFTDYLHLWSESQ